MVSEENQSGGEEKTHDSQNAVSSDVSRAVKGTKAQQGWRDKKEQLHYKQKAGRENFILRTPE